ncbi:aryl hydrocarbon receptor 2 [Chiloscyllium plagiosum]|uniref:aryl hydrocarbon receptor 2 n=1 Tax=Chiloscyllium plagiosum TaxID=36176 RepID=UPI001CB8894E|nr:aryl hydrocarbon receptor 2 [Chiloscyllium plagiosum]XP_043549036.1 aryl hydrocarbon receptor 2 [Chiloscyllium plagiosum]
MLNAGGIYAVKKRKKPVQKSPKPPPADGVKSNPSKRHRDRLNCELDKLTSLLPFTEDVLARLDKLSVLRLSVGYLKAKSFFNAGIKRSRAGWLTDKPSAHFQGNGQQNGQPIISEGDLLLEALNGFILVITAEGYVFYTSPTIQDYLGFHQSDVVHQSVFELIHTDDRAMFRQQLHWALNPPACQESDPRADGIPENHSLCSRVMTFDLPPENSSFMERNFICRFRCLLDNSSGFLTLNFQGRLKFLHGQNKKAEDGTPIPPQLALFAVATPLQPPSILEVRAKTLIFQTKHKLDFTPMACDTKGKFVLGYTEAELCMRGTGYQFIHAADMMYCADNHVRMIKTGESGMTVFRLLTKQNSWVWVQASARLVYRGGRPDSIICKQKPLTNEEGEENLRKRSMQLPFNFATGEAVLYDNNPLLLGQLDSFEIKGKGTKVEKVLTGANGTDPKNGINPSSLLGARMIQNPSAYTSYTEMHFNLDDIFANDFSVLNVPGDFCQPGNHGKTSSKQEQMDLDQADPLSTIMDILSQKNVDENDLCNTLENLDVENTELEQWEETLMKMDNTSIPDDFSDILTSDFILSCVENMLTKDCPEANKFPQEGLDPAVGSTTGPNQHNPLPQKPLGFENQNPAMPGFQNAITVAQQIPMASGPHTPSRPAPQTPVTPGPQSVLPFGLQNAHVPQPQNETYPRIPNPLGSSTWNPLPVSRYNPPNQQGLVPLDLRGLCGSTPAKPSCAGQVSGQQVSTGKMSLPGNLQQSVLHQSQYSGLNGQLEVQSLQVPQQQQQPLPQWQPQMQNGQQDPMLSHRVQDCFQIRQPSCGLTHALPERGSAACYLNQNSSGQLPYSCSIARKHRTTVNQFPMGLPPSTNSSCMFTSCEYEGRAPPPRTEPLFPDSSSLTPLPPYGKTEGLQNHSPFQATCYYENDPVHSVIGSSAVPNGELNIYQTACQFEPNFSALPLAENSICQIPTGQAPWN